MARRRLDPPQHTAPGSVDAGGVFRADRTAWRQTRYQAIVEALLRRGFPLETAKSIALRLLPLFARETRVGDLEFNYNSGNLRPSASEDPAGSLGWHGDYIVRTHGEYRAYPTLADGVEDFLQ